MYVATSPFMWTVCLCCVHVWCTSDTYLSLVNGFLNFSIGEFVGSSVTYNNTVSLHLWKQLFTIVWMWSQNCWATMHTSFSKAITYISVMILLPSVFFDKFHKLASFTSSCITKINQKERKLRYQCILSFSSCNNGCIIRWKLM